MEFYSIADLDRECERIYNRLLAEYNQHVQLDIYDPSDFEFHPIETRLRGYCHFSKNDFYHCVRSWESRLSTERSTLLHERINNMREEEERKERRRRQKEEEEREREARRRREEEEQERNEQRRREEAKRERESREIARQDEERLRKKKEEETKKSLDILMGAPYNLNAAEARTYLNSNGSINKKALDKYEIDKRNREYLAGKEAEWKATNANQECAASQPDADTISITVKGVTFNMKLVEGGMIDENIELSDFYIGETVVTQELWQMIMGENPSKDNRDMQLPVTNISAAMCNAFIRKLDKLTGCDFSIPTYTQWQYAHDGGNKSVKKTAYAGSDNVDEVAWTAENSGRKLQPVAQLEPNELGLFDMDGNVLERCIGDEVKPSSYSFNPISENVMKPIGGLCVLIEDNLWDLWNKYKKFVSENRGGKLSENEFFSSHSISYQHYSEHRRITREAKYDPPQKHELIASGSTIIGLRLAINVPVAESTSKTTADSPLMPILLRQQKQQEPRLQAEAEKRRRKAEEEAEAERRRQEEEAARKRLTHTLTINVVHDTFATMMTLRSLLRWGSTEARQKLSYLPLDVLVTEDAKEAKEAYESLVKSGANVTVTTINGLGETVKNALDIKKK